MNFEDLTPEQKEKARACKTPEEILALAKAEGYELSDEELEGVSGGWGKRAYNCDTNHCEAHACGSFGCSSFTCKTFDSQDCWDLDCWSFN